MDPARPVELIRIWFLGAAQVLSAARVTALILRVRKGWPFLRYLSSLLVLLKL